MNSQDTCQRFIFDNAPIRGEIVHLSTSVTTIIAQHPYPPFIKKLLSEMLVSIVLLTATVKFKGRITIQFQGQNQLKLLTAQCDHTFRIRGLAQWHETLTIETLAADLEHGVLAIMMQPESGGQEGYQGIVAWQENSLARSLEAYFRDSEQLVTRIWLSVTDHHAAGMLLQMMPEKPYTHTTSQQQWEDIIHLTDTLTPDELLTLDHETLLNRLYSHENTVRLFPAAPVMFGCTCSEARSKNAILLTGHAEIEEELKGKRQIIVTCEFCRQHYVYSREDIEQIFQEKGDFSSSTTKH